MSDQRAAARGEHTKKKTFLGYKIALLAAVDENQ